MSLEKILCEELNHCRNCEKQNLTFLLVEGAPFCNWVCFTEWKWRKSKDNVGKTTPKNDVVPTGRELNE